MVEIKAGVELDRAVGEAIGWRIEENRPLDWIGSNGVSVEEFRPSVDLNDAFSAAMRSAKDFYGCVALPPCITVDNRTGWRCSIEDSPEGRGKTAALAICAAILELSKAGNL